MDRIMDEVGGWLAAQMEACTRCGICAAACPFYAALNSPEYAPVWKFDLLRRSFEQRSTLIGRLKTYLHLEKDISQDDLLRWRDINYRGCSTCNRCSVTCPMGIAVGPILHEVRHRLAQAGALPENLQRMSQTVAEDFNVYGFPAEERAGWVEYMLDAPDDFYQRDQAEIVYFVGCVTSFSPRAQRIAEAFVQILTAAGVNFTILGGDEVCCGFPLRSAGLIEQTAELIARNTAAVKKCGAQIVAFTCPACRLMWREEYRPYLPGVQFLHSTELLAGLASSGRLPFSDWEHKVTYHDPCDLARTGGVFEEPRRLLGSIPGLNLVEIPERRASGLCCGGGGDVEMVAPEFVRKVSHRTAARFNESGAEILATACPQCMRVLEEAMKTVNPAMRILDVVEIAANALGITD